MNKKKICLVIPSLHSGGMERVMSELAGCFCEQRDTEIHLVMYGMKPEIFYSLPPNLVIHQPDWKFDNKKRKWNTLKRMFYLRRMLKVINPISILSFGEYWNNFVLLATWGTGQKVYVSDRCQPDKTLGKLHDHLRAWLYPHASGVIVQTEKAKSIYKSYFKHPNIQVIGNPIRDIKDQPDSLKENIILSVGRLIKSKHHDELIRIFAKINPPEWKLIIVGDDALKQQNRVKLESLIINLGMEEKVILAGNCDDVDKYYLKSKIFAFTSSSEGFPNVIGEAQSAGVPVIAFDCIAGPSDLVQDGVNGYLVPLFDYQILELRLKQLIDSEDLRTSLGSNAKLSIREFACVKICFDYYKFILGDEQKK